MSEPMATIMSSGIRHLNLRVRNLQESAAFYSSLFGLTARRPTPNRPGVLICAAPRSAGQPFSIVLTQGLGGQTPTGMDHFAIGVESRDDVEIAFDRAQSMGMRATRPRMFDGHYQTFIFDPDGYKVEVFAELPAESPMVGADESDSGIFSLPSYPTPARTMCRNAI